MSCWLNRWSCLVSIRADYYRYYGHRQLRLAFFKYLIVDLRLRQCVIFRILSCYDSRRRLVKILLFPLAIYYRHLKLITGIQLSAGTRIRNGLVFEHWGGVVITHCAIIGENCTIAQNVTIGWSKRGANRGTPVIGSNVFIGPGAVILGNIKIGNNVAIGANSVVINDIPDNAVAVGSPAKVVSYNGSRGYIFNTDYD